MNSENDVAHAVAALTVEILATESNLAWTEAEQLGRVWKIAPGLPEDVGLQSKESSPEQRLRIAPADEESTQEPFVICITGYAPSERLLLTLADAVYAHFGLLTVAEPEIPCSAPVSDKGQPHRSEQSSHRPPDIHHTGSTDPSSRLKADETVAVTHQRPVSSAARTNSRHRRYGEPLRRSGAMSR
jgi:hypothetical protein